MPFELTNAPATFQPLMNHLFAPYLRKFILVFFDDILVYNPNLKQHLSHLKTTFEVLKVNQPYAKPSKCSFAKSEVEYLGHIILRQGVSIDPSKIVAMMEWPKPSSIRELRGFLRLTGYYRKFIQNYGVISKPLTKLLKKDNFGWNP